jgi:hypothetical protein
MLKFFQGRLVPAVGSLDLVTKEITDAENRNLLVWSCNGGSFSIFCSHI